MLAFYCVLLGDQHGARLVEAELLKPDLGMIVERMRLDLEIRVAQQLEEPLRITDARDSMHGLGAKRVERSHRAVLQAVDLRHDGRRTKHSGVAPNSAVDDDRVDFLQARQGSRRGPAGRHSPLPIPRTPSTTAISNARPRR